MFKWSSTWALACTVTAGYQGILSYSIIYSTVKLVAVPMEEEICARFLSASA